ncbi:MAG: transcription-repair coupling factor [Eubacteriales bacterium]
MKQLLQYLETIDEFNQIDTAIATGNSPVAFSGLSLVHRALSIARFWESSKVCQIVFVADEEEGKALQKDLKSLLDVEVPLYPSRPFSFYGEGSHQWEQQRIGILSGLEETPVVIATIEGALQRTIPPKILAKASFTVKVGDTIPLEDLSKRLVESGYTHSELVESIGQFSIRGGILDIYSPNCNHPVRLDFFGDDLDSMGYFLPDTQRRTENLEELTILPVSETLPHLCQDLENELLALEKKKGETLWQETLENDRKHWEMMKELPTADRYLEVIYPEFSTLLDHVPVESQVIFSECNKVMDRAKTWQWQMEEEEKSLLERGKICGSLCHFLLTQNQFFKKLEEFPVIYLDFFTLSTYPTPPKALVSLTARQISPFGSNLLAAKEDSQAFAKGKVLVLLSSPQRCASLYQQWQEEGFSCTLDTKLEALPEEGQVYIAQGILSGGFQLENLLVLVEGVGSPLKQRKQKAATNRQHLKSCADLVPGDLVVHEVHGIGRYKGMETMKVDGVDKDYICLAYAGTDELYIPATQLDVVSKYIGGGEEAQAAKKLNKLGGSSWEKSKKQAKKAVADLAKGLIKLYAQREKLKGFAFSPDAPWQEEFEEEFPYPETEDQLRSIAEIKMDMERSRPMDRLLCGDVGFGKTEVAFRAMMKCILDGKQTAILVPTTVLARQHFLTALSRFRNHPVKIDVVSRFRTPAQMKETLAKVASGEVDILIGTHRLFQKDVIFHDLGLLVVDEEQRFGVSHKEKLKERFAQVDVLTLSATPIPRTLNMALSGIRDMSSLEEPPPGRQPVQTFVMEENWAVLVDAMKREIERGGQVFFLHNRVEGIERTARNLREMLGETAHIAVAHGRMEEKEINQVMGDMTDGRVNVLVCTTIIETGIDLPNANTLVIQDADRMGLSQLHQIRGRVGRSSRRAFAYLTYREGKILTEVASKRLSALREFAEFGAGFQIAMRDLEIRGAGNVLGPEQSGFLLSVGYDMYLRLLEEAVLTEQGLPLPENNICVADLTVAASVPDRYVPQEKQRMDLYRRIASLRSEEDADDLVDELIDRYGEPPRTVNNLISVALLRAKAQPFGITRIVQQREKIHWYFKEMPLEAISQLCNHKRYLRRLVFVPGDEPQIALALPQGDVLETARRMLSDLEEIMSKGELEKNISEKSQENS